MLNCGSDTPCLLSIASKQLSPTSVSSTPSPKCLPSRNPFQVQLPFSPTNSIFFLLNSFLVPLLWFL